MNPFLRRHFQSLDRWSAMLLAMGLGYVVLSQLGDGKMLAAMLLITVGAFFRALLFDAAERA
jgi:hypothetical protein